MIIDCSEEGGNILDRKEGLIVTTSWDDGTINDSKLANLLDKYGISGTFYIARSGSTLSYLSEKEIVAIGEHFEIGAHTMVHPDLTSIPLSQAKCEIMTSKTYLENLLGYPVSMFCYPWGKHNSAIRQIVKSYGFIGARTCESMVLSLSLDPYQLPISLQASDNSPLKALKACLKSHLFELNALFDWESRLKILFDRALKIGGVYHIYGHSHEFNSKNEWCKLESALAYISRNQAVRYMTNGELVCMRMALP